MDIRYYVEHVALPTLVKERPQELCQLVSQGKEKFLVEMYAQASSRLNQPFDYVEEDFHVDLVKYKDEYFFQIIRMPDKGIKPPFCHYVFISLDVNQSNARYFTIENQGQALLFCEWQNFNHYAYGKFLPDEDPLERIIKIRKASDEIVEKKAEESSEKEVEKVEEPSVESNKQETESTSVSETTPTLVEAEKVEETKEEQK